MAANIKSLVSPDNNIESLSLSQGLENLGGFDQEDIPFGIWLLENPRSPLCLPGSIDLFGHDCIHVLLECGLTLEDEAFVIGFTMGNDPKTKTIHLAFYKFFSSFLFPASYQFQKSHWDFFDLGFEIGRKSEFSSIHKVDFENLKDIKIEDLRKDFGVDINQIREAKSSVFTAIGSKPQSSNINAHSICSN